MERTHILGLVVGLVVIAAVVGGAFVVAGNNADTADNPAQNGAQQEMVENPPEAVAEVRPLAEDFKVDMASYYPNSRVTIVVQEPSKFSQLDTNNSAGVTNQTGMETQENTQQARIVIEVSPDASSGDGVEQEMGRIALRYSEILSESNHDAASLSIVTGQVEMVVPKTTVERHANGNLTDEAFMETIEVRSIDSGNNGEGA